MTLSLEEVHTLVAAALVAAMMPSQEPLAHG